MLCRPGRRLEFHWQTAILLQGQKVIYHALSPTGRQQYSDKNRVTKSQAMCVRPQVRRALERICSGPEERAARARQLVGALPPPPPPPPGATNGDRSTLAHEGRHCNPAAVPQTALQDYATSMCGLPLLCGRMFPALLALSQTLPCALKAGA